MGRIRKRRENKQYTGPIPEGFVEYPNRDGYWVNPEGVIASTRRGTWHIMTQRTTQFGYKSVDMMQPCGTKSNPIFVHRMVAEAFIGPGKGLDVNHKDGVKINNNLSNLEWATRKENSIHAVENKLRVYITGEGNPSNKYTQDQVIEIRRLYSEELLSPEKIAKQLGIPKSTVYRIANNRVYIDKTYIPRKGVKVCPAA